MNWFKQQFRTRIIEPAIDEALAEAELNRRFVFFGDDEIKVLYDGLMSHGGDSADESLMEEIEDEAAFRGIHDLDTGR